MVKRIKTELPDGISFTSLSASLTPPVPLAAVAPPTTAPTGAGGGSTETTTTPTTVPVTVPTINGTLTIQGKAPDFPTLARWIDAMGNVPEISDIYVTSATAAGGGDGTTPGITWAATAIPTPKSASDRVGSFVEAAK